MSYYWFKINLIDANSYEFFLKNMLELAFNPESDLRIGSFTSFASKLTDFPFTFHPRITRLCVRSLRCLIIS